MSESNVLTPAVSDTNNSVGESLTNIDHQANQILGANMAAQEQGSKSLYETASDLVTKAAPLTGAAIFNSFYNTAAEVGNFLGGDVYKANIADEFGPDSDTTEYYTQHLGPIEGVALAAGSLLPGLGATKLLKLAQVGKFGEAMQVSTGLFSGIKDTALKAATDDLIGNATGESLFGLTTVNKTKAILAGFADNALQGAVYETATLATMHASPLTDNNTIADNISDIKDSMLGFGVVGGLIEGAGIFSKINKAVKAADLSSKSQEAFGARGLGKLTPGDRVVTLYDTLDKIPEATSKIEAMKLNATTGTTGRLIQEQLIKAAGGDEEVAGAFRSFLEKGRADGTVGSEELSNNLSLLSKLGRHGDTSVASQPSEVFYIPKSIDSSVVSTATHDDLMSRIATGPTIASKAFQLTSPTVLPTIGRATDRGVLAPLLPGSNAVSYSKFKNAADAYKQGVDIYIDGKGVTHINPGATSIKETTRPGESRILTPTERAEYVKTGNLPSTSKPLDAVGLTLDVTSGKLFGESPLPVVGDIAKPNLYANGLRVGESNFPQKAGEEFSPSSPLDANARYVWAALRGIKNGDAIHPTDLPMLEQLYREKSLGVEHKNLDTFTDGTTIPKTAPDLLQHIADLKQAKYVDLLGARKNADEIGHILNAPAKGMTTNFNTLNPQDLMIPTSESSNIKHLRLAYDIGTTRDSQGNLLRGMQATNYRIKLATDGNANQVANYLARTVGPVGNKSTSYFSALQFTKGTGDADLAGAGAGFFSNANASYGTLGQQAERIGRAATELLTMRHSIVSDTLAAAANKVRADPVAAAEYGNFVAVRHSTGENYILLKDADAMANGFRPGTAILEGAVSTDAKTGKVTINPNYIPPGFSPGSKTIGGASTATAGPISYGPQLGTNLKTFYQLSPKVVELELASQLLNNSRNTLRSDWWKAQGVPKDTPNPDRLYTPPINTTKYPFMAYVRQREGYALGQSGASVITAKSAEELQSKISLLGPDYDAFTKGDIANFKKAQGEYEFNRNFQTNQVATEMARKGILNNVVPETRGANLIDDLANWHYRQEDQLLRDHIELHNAATFDQLKAMGDRFDQTGTSRFGAITPFMQRSATNPYQSYVRTALGLTKNDNYPLWQLAQEKLEAYASSAFNTVRDAFGASQKGLLPVEEAAKVSDRMGLGNPYGVSLEQMSKNYYGGLANSLPDSRTFSKFVATANTTLGATVIRLDTFQQLIHAVTMPIMVALEHSSATADLKALTSVTVPGSSQQVPGFTRTLFNAVKNYFGPDSEKLQELYQQTGLTRDELTIHRQMINQLSMPLGKLSESGWAQKIDGATQSAEKLTGTKFTNSFIHFVASDVGRQISEAQGIGGRDMLDNIATFTNRVLGNVSAGQRAGIFSGPVGQAVGLFQSYQWNLMQQLLRHIGDGDVKALAMGAGMQSSIFGLSSLPGFHALNSLIASRHGNTQGSDLYSGANQLLGHETADYLLYGSLAGLTGLSLYSRGDLNPRRASILPVNPLEFPSVSAGVRVYQTLAQLESNITTKGGNVPASLLLAAEHNGLSRPLTGLAELAQGFATTSDGRLISKVSGLSDLSNVATMSRILGAKPLDESVAMDALYRNNALKVLDTARLQQLGSAAKTALYDNSPVSPQVTQQFMSDYVKAGGNQENFNQWFLQQAKGANVAAVNKSFENFHNPRSKSLQETMGGIPLPDFRTVGSTQVAPAQPTVPTPP